MNLLHMESIRNIKEKIKSCVSCNENLCPIIRERLERHMLSHQASTGQANRPNLKYRKSSGTPSSRTVLMVNNSDEPTSTSNLIEEQLEHQTSKKSIYKKRVTDTLDEWTKDLPTYPTVSAEGLKQNLVNELMEKINDMYSEVGKDYYVLNLSLEIDKFIDSLPSLSEEPENEHNLGRLKEVLVKRICNLNNNIVNCDAEEPLKNTRGNKTTVLKIKDNATNTQEGSNNLKHTEVHDNGTSVPYSSVDTEGRHSFSTMNPYYGNMFKEQNVKMNSQQNTDVVENIYKQIIFDWLDDVNKSLDRNGKKIVAEAVLNRLKRLLSSKSTLNHKLLIKAEVFNSLNEYADTLLLSPENYTYLNRLSEDLTVKLLSVKFSHEQVYSMSYTSYFQKYFDNTKPVSCMQIDHFQHFIQKIINERFENLDISSSTKRDLVNIILKNIKLICMRRDYYIEVHIFNILKHFTELSDYSISSLTNSILDDIRTEATSKYLKTYNSVFYDENFRPSLISVYKSEHEMSGSKSNNSESSRNNYSSGNNYQYLTTEDKKYVESMSQLLKAWLTTLPVNTKMEKKKNKETIINNLAYDILDQVKLEQIVPETRAEKKKNISFFIHRWLKRLNWFQNIADAQPCVENLIEKLQGIPVPTSPMNNKHSKTSKMRYRRKESDEGESLEKYRQPHDQPKKTEAILKDFIVKYIEHNYYEDNATAREVFGHILKNELQKLSTPTRREVYGNIQNTVDNDLASEKLLKDLQYINIISDWLKNLPLDDSFNITGNNDRAQYVNDFAKTINDMEESRSESEDVDYERLLKSRILQFTEILPIRKLHTYDIATQIDELISNVTALRYPDQCCGFKNEKDLSLNICNLPDHNLSDLIEVYIRENSDEIEDDELKLDAWSLRIFKEIDNMARENPTSLSTFQVYNKLAEMSLQGDQLGERFNMELNYAKEISNWLNNLPLQAIRDKSMKDLIVKMISNLAEKMAERYHIKKADANNTQIDSKLEDYIKKWITELPLDRTKEIVIPVVVQQIWNRMGKVNTEKVTYTKIQQIVPEYASNICESHNPCCERNPAVTDFMKRDPGTEIVEAIEAWCNNLPIQSDSESMDHALKEELSTRLYKKVSELNKNPNCFSNNILYLQMLEEEIDTGLDNLPQNSQLQHARKILKRQILNKVNENRNVMRKKAAGIEYRQELEKVIEMSLPNPVFINQKDCPGFKIYKNLLAQLFILENFDHLNDDFKNKCTKKLRNKIDYYFKDVQNMNAITLGKDQMLNELYSLLSTVPVPNEDSIVEEVVEIKTGCVIEDWFENLPMKEADGVEELLERDQIISMLAKRLLAIEKNNKNSNDKIHKEIRKWLMKLPILPDKEKKIDILANVLQQRLKLSANDRKCKPRDRNSSLKEFLVDSINKGTLENSQVAGPSSDVKLWLSPMSSSPEFHSGCCKNLMRPSDLLLDIIETWCQQLPLLENTQEEKDNAKIIKDNLFVKIIMKIGELNVNSEAFENDLLYDAILDKEIEYLMSTLPVTVELKQNKNYMKNQLKDSIKSVKPRIKEEKERYAYKQDLKNTVDHILEHPQNAAPAKVALLVILRDEIVDDFIVYSFSMEGKEDRKVYKMMVQRAVQRYIVEKENITNDIGPDPLFIEKQLFCELAKVPAPSADAISEEVNEIRMKFELNTFFKELPVAEDESKVPLQDLLKYTLAKRLSHFSKDSLIKNHHKVKDEIMKCLNKIQNEIDPQKVEQFIKRLEKSESTKKSQISFSDNKKISLLNEDVLKTDTQTGNNTQRVDNKNNDEEQWMSLLPGTSTMKDQNCPDTISIREYRKSLEEVFSPAKGQGFDRNLHKSEVTYEKFKGGDVLTSLRKRKSQTNPTTSDSNDQFGVLNPNESQNLSIGPRRDVPNSPGFQSINNSSHILQSCKRRLDFIQQKGMGSDQRPPAISSLKSQSSNAYSQELDLTKVRTRPYPATQNQPLTNQGSQQSNRMASDCCNNRMCSNSSKYNFNSMLAPTQPTSENEDVILQTPASSKQNLEDPAICNLAPYSMPQFSSQGTSYSISRCKKNCRRPSIILLSSPNKNSNHLDMDNQNRLQCNSSRILTEDEDKCLCTDKREKQYRGSPACPVHTRKQCRVCNRPNPFRYLTPYRHYYDYR